MIGHPVVEIMSIMRSQNDYRRIVRQTDGRTDRQMDGQTDNPTTTKVGGGITSLSIPTVLDIVMHTCRISWLKIFNFYLIFGGF